MSDRDARMTENASFILAKKELKLLFKSKRRIFLLTITPLMILLIGIIAVGAATVMDDTVEPTQISVINDSPSNFTTQLVSLYDTIEDTDIVEIGQSYDDIRESKNFEVLVYFPSNFTSLMQDDQPANVVVVYNTNSSLHQTIAFQVIQLTNAYEQQLLVSENPNVQFNRIQPSLLETEEEETGGLSEELASSIFIIPVYIIFFVVIPPISLIMISVTQEREMQTLETLFLQPVPRNSIISGKILYGLGIVGIVLILDIIAVIIDVILFNIFLSNGNEGEIWDILAEFSDFIGVDIISYFLLSIIVISALIVGLAVLLSLVAKDEREANLISSILPLFMVSIIFVVQLTDLVGLPLMAQIFLSIVPILGVLVALYISLVAGSIGLIGFAGIISQVLWIIFTIRFAARLSESESILELNARKMFVELKKMFLFK